MKPRVLVVVRWPVGGIRTWCRYVYRDARFEKYDIEIMIPDDPEGEWLQKDLEDAPVRVNVLKGVSTTVRFALRVSKRILSDRFQFVHSHGFTSGLASAVPCGFRGVPHLVTPHDVVLDWQYQTLRRRMARRLIGVMLHSATRLQPVGEAAAANLRNSFGMSEVGQPPISVVRNGIDVGRFTNAIAVDVRAMFDIPRDAIVVGFFGRFMAQKGFRYLIEAVELREAAGSSERPIVVVAAGGGGFRKQEEASIREKGLSHRFRFVDFTPNIAGLMKGVDVVAMPSLWEACPLLPMEALVAGVPLVVSDFPACLEIVADSPACVIPTRDSQELLEAVVSLGGCEARRRAEAFSTEAARRFSVDRTIDGIVNLYREMLV